MIETTQPGADQAHVVIERQPADEHIAGAHLGRLPHGTDIGQQVGMAEHHTFGLAGAAGGVLQ